MNYRRALRIATDTGLAIFMIMIVGVILWTADEILNWNILPDWIDRFAQLLVIVLSILAGFAVVISMMCSFALMAESAAEKAGIATPPRSGRARLLIAGALVLGFGIMFGLHKVDQYRAEKRRQADEQKTAAKHVAVQKELEQRMPAIVTLFAPEISKHLAETPSDPGDEAAARLLNAIQSSTPFNPQVNVIVNAAPPFKYCIISTASEAREPGREAAPKPLRRQYLTDLPAQWENDAIAMMFRGEPYAIQRQQHGVFVDGRNPSAAGTLTEDGKVVAVVMLRATRLEASS